MNIEISQPDLTLLTFIHESESRGVTLKEASENFTRLYGMDPDGNIRLQNKGNGTVYESIALPWIDCTLFLFNRGGFLKIPAHVLNTRLSTYPGRDYVTTREVAELNKAHAGKTAAEPATL